MMTGERDLLMWVANLVHDHLPDVADADMKHLFSLMVRVFEANNPSQEDQH